MVVTSVVHPASTMCHKVNMMGLPVVTTTDHHHVTPTEEALALEVHPVALAVIPAVLAALPVTMEVHPAASVDHPTVTAVYRVASVTTEAA